jgi:5-methylcytosine-specific restriction protein A
MPNPIWSPAEIEAAVDAYASLYEKQSKGEVVVKNRVYNSLAREYGRSPSAYDYRFRNISHVLTTMGLPTLAGLRPAEHVGPTAEVNIRQVIDAKGYFGDELALPTADPEQLERRTRALRRRGLPSVPVGAIQPPRVTSTTERVVRDPKVKAWVLDAADGYCENCGQPAPFVQEDGTPFLEVHHIKWLAEGGSDTVTNAVALCPNCHRRFHYGTDAADSVAGLIGRVGRLIAE